MSQEDDDWRAKAKCLGLGHRRFIPDGPGGSLDSVVAICNGTHDGFTCPVREECGDFGFRNNMIGVWGGQVRSSRDWLAATRSIRVYVEVRNAKKPQ